MTSSLWQGLTFVIVGAIMALLTPKLVRFQERTQDRLFHWQAKVFGLEQTPFIKATSSSAFARWKQFSTWLGLFLVAAVLIFIGIAILTGLISGRP